MDLWTVHLGTVPYGEALALQERVRAARQADAIPDTVLLLEHPPVYTRGRRAAPGELPLGEAFYAERGIEIVDVDRGGKVTFHGPGQLVAYPVVRVGDVMGFVGLLEQAMVEALAQAGVAGRGRAADGRDFTGVWVGERKIGSIGLHISHGVTTHGLSVNVDGDLTPFEWIVPCGLGGVAMTSIAEEVAVGADVMDCFRKRLAHRLAEGMGRRQRIVTPARLERELAGLPVG
ncbi:MAG TPA: lipoyl(octanoyl) transferase LipB [Baekduia sp.]|uniref:lipoyl(octanoyl) transferase LipB n=1 Tax=Baekduia sp. TaxID=2600305 RepID=UPI002B5F8B4D|nr:lipoyl(octanoyl) transferase LipB [Baekduia sp.]HMJ33211.1 lipoyl(octanoyl) transferase LipB [Baekduia sp.]